MVSWNVYQWQPNLNYFEWDLKNNPKGTCETDKAQFG